MLKCQRLLAFLHLRAGKISCLVEYELSSIALGPKLHKVLAVLSEFTPLRELQMDSHAQTNMPLNFFELWAIIMAKNIKVYPFITMQGILTLSYLLELP